MRCPKKKVSVNVWFFFCYISDFFITLQRNLDPNQLPISWADTTQTTCWQCRRVRPWQRSGAAKRRAVARNSAVLVSCRATSMRTMLYVSRECSSLILQPHVGFSTILQSEPNKMQLLSRIHLPLDVAKGLCLAAASLVSLSANAHLF